MCFHKYKEIDSFVTKTTYSDFFGVNCGVTNIIVKICKCRKCGQYKGYMIDDCGEKQKLSTMYVYKAVQKRRISERKNS
jgi:hypothetical protein